MLDCVKSDKTVKVGGRLYIVRCVGCGKVMDNPVTKGSIKDNQHGCRDCFHKSLKKTNAPYAETAAFASFLISARKRSYDIGLSFNMWRDIVTQPCHYCGEESSNCTRKNSSTFLYNGVDRVDNNIGYWPFNCVSCCCHCNYAKRTQDYDEFIDRNRRVANKHQVQECHTTEQFQVVTPTLQRGCIASTGKIPVMQTS